MNEPQTFQMLLHAAFIGFFVMKTTAPGAPAGGRFFYGMGIALNMGAFIRLIIESTP